MRRALVLFAVLFGLVGLSVIPAEAQYRRMSRSMSRNNDRGLTVWGTTYGSRTSGYRGYGYYDPAYLQQMFSLPEGLVACQLNFETGKVESCHTLLKTIEYMEGHAIRHESLNEVLGTYHVEKGKYHFRSFDDTNSRLGRTGAILTGGTAGAVGGGVLAGRKGAVVGGGIGAFAGWLASHKANKHDNCMEVGNPSKSAVDLEPAAVEQELELASRQEQVLFQPAVSVSPTAGITWPTINTTDFRAVVTDPNVGKERLIPAGGSANLPEPSGEQPYAVVLLAPGRGSIDRVPGEIRPSQDLQGWEIVARQEVTK